MLQIPPQDKEAVVDRLAEGQSYFQAMADTAIRSKDLTIDPVEYLRGGRG